MIDEIAFDRIERQAVHDPGTGCMVWVGYVSKEGYGRVTIEGVGRYVHRVALEASGMVIPEGWGVDHLCSNRACINPSHLQPVSPSENTRRARDGRLRRLVLENPGLLGRHERWDKGLVAN